MRLRCYAKEEGDLFVAVCIDLSLAAQGSSIEEAKENLDSQILFYLKDVVENEKDNLQYLVPRKAHWSQLLTYHYLKWRNKTIGAGEKFQRYLRNPSLPSIPDHSHSH